MCTQLYPSQLEKNKCPSSTLPGWSPSNKHRGCVWSCSPVATLPRSDVIYGFWQIQLNPSPRGREPGTTARGEGSALIELLASFTACVHRPGTHRRCWVQGHCIYTVLRRCIYLELSFGTLKVCIENTNMPKCVKEAACASRYITGLGCRTPAFYFWPCYCHALHKSLPLSTCQFHHLYHADTYPPL